MNSWWQIIPAAHALSRRLTHRIGVLAALAVTMLVVAACSATPAPAGIRLDERDNGKTVKLYVGDYLYVDLRDYPTSGYRWDADTELFDMGLLGGVGFMGWTSFTADVKAVGSGGIHTTAMKASGVGQDKLTFVYHSVGEDYDYQGSPVKTFEVELDIQPRPAQ
jgi:predicted secreted protein